MADGPVLYIGGATINLLTTCNAEHKLHVYDGTNVYCASATTDNLSNALHVSYNGTVYSICNGECDSEEPVISPDHTIENCRLTDADADTYISANGTQFINTGVVGSNKVEIQATANVTDIMSSVNTYVWSLDSTEYRYTLWYDVAKNGKDTLYLSRAHTTASASSTKNLPIGNKTTYRMATNGMLYLNNVSKIQHQQSATLTADGNILIFGNSGGTTSPVKMYRVKLYNNGTLVRDFVPVPANMKICDYTTPSAGMFDIVNQQFYGNSGTGTFTYGIDQ